MYLLYYLDRLFMIADIKGHIGGMLTSGAGKTSETLDITYATPFWWLLQLIRAKFLVSSLGTRKNKFK